MKPFELFTTDMDDTLLDSEKRLSDENRNAINRALEQGKIVVLATGRCLCELEEYLPQFPRLRYIIAMSGAYLYDLKEEKVLYRKSLPKELVQRLERYSRENDIMTQVLSGKDAFVRSWQVHRMPDFQMAHYQAHFEHACAKTDDLGAVLAERDWTAEKINLYHRTPEEREQTMELLKGEPVELAFAESTGLEISPLNVDKGTGLEQLCAVLGIAIEQTISVGDGFNDVPIFRKAGLSVAVRNAKDAVKEQVDVIVPSADENGVKEAVEWFLLPRPD